ncbi:hypothetical protein Tco_1106163 [Tanacetum coccineum]
MTTSMFSDTKLRKDEECESVTSTKYRGMIGSLLYLTASRPDIMFSVYLCARFQEAPKTSHLEAVKRIFRYIKGTTHLRLWYPKGTSIETVVYADSDHAGDYVDRKRNSEGQVRRIRHDEEIDVLEYQILTREIVPTLKPLEEIIREYNFCLGYYVLYDRVMNPLAAQQERKPRKDCGMKRGRHSTSSSSAFDQSSSSHINDDDDRNGKETSRASTPSPIRYVNSLTNEVP